MQTCVTARFMYWYSKSIGTHPYTYIHEQYQKEAMSRFMSRVIIHSFRRGRVRRTSAYGRGA